MNIDIYNVMGDVVYEHTMNQGKAQIDLSYLSNGVYIVKVNTTTYKLVIQK
jgi:hypothetical protein